MAAAVAGTITSPQGYRTDPITGETSYHSGTDIAVPEGTPILAAADGTVTIANALDSWGGSYGYHVKLDHGGGLTTLYAHCSSICVTAGQQVKAGRSLPTSAPAARRGRICILRFIRLDVRRFIHYVQLGSFYQICTRILDKLCVVPVFSINLSNDVSCFVCKKTVVCFRAHIQSDGLPCGCF